MPRIYAVGDGYAVQIGGFGVATATVPAIVPEDVAMELAGRTDLRIEDGGARAFVHAADDNGNKAAIELEAEE